MAETIEIAITSADVISLKQSCQVIIDAYKTYASSLVVSDETGIYPMLLEQMKGLRVDVEAGKNTLDNFEKLTLDEIDRPVDSLGKLNSYKDVEKFTGNYTVSQSVYDDAQTQVKEIFDGMKDREVPRTEETQGLGFRKDGFVDETSEDYSSLDYSQSLPNAQPEQINPAEGFSSPTKVVSGIQAETAGTKPTASYKNKSKGKYKNTTMETCIPCGLRLDGLDDINISGALLGVLEELLNKYRALIDQMKALLNNTEIADDICSLLNFLDPICVPDLYALIVLLSTLMNKYRDLIPNLDGAFLQFIGPFFGPMLNGLNELLDKFIQMIMGPVDCIINSLDNQLAKLDVKRALDVAEIQNISYHRKRERYLRNKKEQLEERRSYLSELKQNPDEPLSGNRPPPQIVGGYKGQKSYDLANKFDNAAEPSEKQSPGIFSAVTINEEIATIDDDLADVKAKYQTEYGEGGENNLTELIRESQVSSPNVLGKTKGALRNARQGLSSSLYELRNQALNGRRMVNDTLTVMRDELQRLIFGRAATSGEMMEGARNIQRIARLIGVVNTLIKLANNKNICENSNGDPSVALGSFLTANSGTEQKNNYYNVYVGQNDGGEQSLLIAPSDAVLELADPETDEITQLDNLDEIKKLNSDGIPKDVGDITDKKVTATVTDLGFQVPVSVIEFNLCRGSNLSTDADVSKIEQWAVSAGFSV